MSKTQRQTARNSGSIRVTYIDKKGKTKSGVFAESVATQYFRNLCIAKDTLFACAYDVNSGDLLTWPIIDDTLGTKVEAGASSLDIVVTDDGSWPR